MLANGYFAANAFLSLYASYEALKKYNEALAHNKKLRENIDNLRRERLVFDQIYKKLEKELAEKKKEMARIIEISNKAYEARARAGALVDCASSRAAWVESEAAQHALYVPARAAELTAETIQETLALTMPPDRFVSLTLVPDNAALAPQPEVPKAASEAPKAIPVSA